MAAPTSSAPAAAADLIDLLRRSGIHPLPLLDEKLAEFDLPDDAAGAAAALVRGGLLTTFQSRLLLAGKYRGFKLGTYVIRDQLGKGGMGTVYLAEHASLRRKVAIKVLMPEGAAQKAGVERFLREARSAAALDHPNIVRVFDVLQAGELHYLVMEYVDGKTLDSLVQHGGAMAPGRAVGYISQAAAGLQHAYEKGFVHRDIKPANLIVAKDGTVKLLDMGLARSVVDGGDRVTELLDDGAVVGTADFISPEQATNAPGIDIRADIYSLGATLFALIAGRPPFEGSTSQVLMQHQLKSPPALSDFDRTIAPGLAAVVAKMLAKKAADRYATPAEVIAALAPWLPNRDGAQRVMAGLSTSELGRSSANLRNTLNEVMTGASTGRLNPAGGPTGRRRKQLLLGGLAVGLLVAAGAGYALFGGSSQPPAAGAGADARVGSAPAQAAVKPVPSPAPAFPSRPVLYRFVPEGLPDFRVTIDNKPLAGSQPAELPAGCHISCWKSGSTGELVRTTLDGQPAFGLASRTGEPSAQCVLPLASDEFDPAREYVLRVTYLTQGDAGGFVLVQNVTDNYSSLGEVRLPPDTPAWRTEEVRFKRPAGAEIKLAFQSDRVSAAGNMAFVGAIELADPAAVKPVFRLDLAATPAFRQRVRNSRRLAGNDPKFPAGVGVFAWKPDTEAEFTCEPVDGRPAVGVTNLSGAASGQLSLGLESADDGMGLALTPGADYELRFAYKLTNGSGRAYVQHCDFSAIPADLSLTDTAGAWRPAALRFARKDAPLRLVIDNLGVGADKTLYLRDVEVVPAGGPAPAAARATAPPAGDPLFQFDPAVLPEFKATTLGWDKVTSGRLPKLPAGLQLSSWKPAAVADYTRAAVAGRPALGFASRGADPTAEVIFNLTELGVEPIPGRAYLARLNYLTDAGADPGAMFRAQEIGGSFPTTAEVALEPTGGDWRTAELQFKRSPGPATRLTVQASRSIDKGLLHLGRLEVFDPTAAAAVAPVRARGAKLYALDLSGLPAFRGKYADGKPDGNWPVSAPGLSWFCWKPASVAEFRGEATPAGPAVGVTNLSDEASSQFNIGLEDAPSPPPLTAGRKYLLRVEYKADNDATGGLVVRLPDYTSFARAELPSTGGAWKWAELGFTKPDGKKVHAIVDNTAVGEGNTLWLRTAEVYEAR